MSERKTPLSKPKVFANPEEVRAALRLALDTSTRKTPGRHVLSVLKRKTAFPLSSDLVLDVADRLAEPPADESTRFLVITEGVLSHRSADLLSQVAREMIRQVRQQIGYFALMEAAGPKAIDPDDLIHWVEKVLQSTPDQSGKRKTPAADTVRLAFTAILPDFSRDHFLDAALGIIRRASTTSASPPLKRPDMPDTVLRDFGQGIATLLKGTPLSLKHLKLAISLATPLERSRRRAIENLSIARYELDDSKREGASLRDRVASLEAQVAHLEKTRIESAAQVESGRKDLTEEKLRYEALDRHWSEVSRGERAQALFEMKRRLEHETTEILLSLEREAPNVPMALDRVRNIRETLASIGSAL